MHCNVFYVEVQKGGNMMKDDTQFSIYKIDNNKFLSIRGMEELSVTQQTQEKIQKLKILTLTGLLV